MSNSKKHRLEIMLNIINAEWDIMSNGKNVGWIHRQNVDVKVPPVKNVNGQNFE
jgi:hypothetical protein